MRLEIVVQDYVISRDTSTYITIPREGPTMFNILKYFGMPAAAIALMLCMITDAPAQDQSADDIIDHIANIGSDVNARDAGVNTLLNEAARDGRSEEVKAMLARGADINALVEDRTALGSACDSGNPETVRVLLDAGADVNMYNEAFPVLLIAVKSNNLEIVKLLLARGADVSNKTLGEMALYEAFLNNNKEMADLLVSYGAKPG